MDYGFYSGDGTGWVECVMEVDEERVRLEKLAEELVDCDEEDAQVCLQNNIYLNIFMK